MTFNNISIPEDSLAHYVNFLLGFTEANTTSYILAAKARATNTAKYELAMDIWRNADGWEFDDSGNSGLPEADLNMVDDTQDVTLPTGALQIRRVEVLLSDGVTYARVRHFDETNIRTSIEEFRKNKAIPTWYRLTKNIIKLFPPPDTSQVTASSGLRILFNREVNEFTGATTTTEIGFDPLGDDLVAYKVAYEYAFSRSMKAADKLKGKIDELKDKVLNQYANRQRDSRPKIQPIFSDYE